MEVSAAVHELGAGNQGLVTSAQLRQHGVPRWLIAREITAGRLLRVRPQVFALAPLPPRPRFVVGTAGVDPAYVLHVRSLLLSLGTRYAAAGRTAAALYGWGMLVEPSRTDEVAVAHGRGTVKLPKVACSQRRSARVSSVRVGSGTDPMRVLSPLQTAVDCLHELPVQQAVVLVDSALRGGSVTLEELVGAVADLGCKPWSAVARRRVDLVDPLSGSVLESVFRIRLLLAGVTGFRVQELLGSMRVDFCFPEARLVIETDGARWHQEPARDQARDNALAELGWRVLRLTWSDVLHDWDATLASVRAALCVTGAVPRAA